MCVHDGDHDSARPPSHQRLQLAAGVGDAAILLQRWRLGQERAAGGPAWLSDGVFWRASRRRWSIVSGTAGQRNYRYSNVCVCVCVRVFS